MTVRKEEVSEKRKQEISFQEERKHIIPAAVFRNCIYGFTPKLIKFESLHEELVEMNWHFHFSGLLKMSRIRYNIDTTFFSVYNSITTS